MDSLFFWISKLVWLLVSPDSLLLIVMTVGVLFLWFGSVKWSKIILTTAILIMLFIAFFPVGEWLLYPLESKYPNNIELPDQVDGIIVLSGAEDTVTSKSWNSVEVGGAAERDLAFMALARKYPEAKLVFTGGSGSMIHQDTKAADIAKTMFVQQGFDVERVQFERDSRNTYENVIFTQKLVQPQSDEKWLLITTSWHMPRSMGIFCKNRWEVIPYPVDHYTQRDNLMRIDFEFRKHLEKLGMGVKEWLGILAYTLTGKMESCS